MARSDSGVPMRPPGHQHGHRKRPPCVMESVEATADCYPAFRSLRGMLF